MQINWLSKVAATLAAFGRRLAYAAMRPNREVPLWDGWDVDSDRRREINDLEAIRVRFPDHS